MKNFRRILAMLLAVLMLCGTTGAFADASGAPGAARTVSNDDEEALVPIVESHTLKVGQRKQIIRNESSTTGRFEVSLSSSDPNVVEIISKRSVRALAPGKCIVTATIIFGWDRNRRPRKQSYEITVVGGPVLSANGRTVKDDDVIRMKVRIPVLLEVKYLNSLWIKSCSSSDPSVLKIVTRNDLCALIPMRPGRCTVTVRLYGGLKLPCKVLVTA